MINNTLTMWNCLREVANLCIDVARYSFVYLCRFKTSWNPIGKEIELGFAGVEFVANKNSCLWGMSYHHLSSSSCCNCWGQPSCSGFHIRGSNGMGWTPICKCGELLVVWVARTSRNNGRQIWGCLNDKVRLMCLKTKFICHLPFV